MVGAMHGPGGDDPQRQRDAEPTADQLIAMAYADGELGAAERAAFQARLAREPELGREVARHRALEVLARRLAPPEPLDHEWQRLALDPLQRGALGLGWLALAVGVLGLVGLGLWRFVADDSIAAVERGLVVALVLGVVALLAAAVRARLRTLPFDPYRNVER
jgi:anti-sigma factor RsiW